MKKFQDMDKDQESELLPKVFHMNTGHPGNPPNPPLEKGGRRGDFWNGPAAKINPWGWSFAKLGCHFFVSGIFTLK
jgi:hypothetical protein